MCPKCGRPVDHCVCKKQVVRPASDGIVRIFRDSKSRKGKTVTLITGLSMKDEDLKTLVGQLKRQFGTGGSVKDGLIEIQGDHREAVQETLSKMGIKAKLAGG
jgi:translation initiation factor 1